MCLIHITYCKSYKISSLKTNLTYCKTCCNYWDILLQLPGDTTMFCIQRKLNMPFRTHNLSLQNIFVHFWLKGFKLGLENYIWKAPTSILRVKKLNFILNCLNDRWKTYKKLAHVVVMTNFATLPIFGSMCW